MLAHKMLEHQGTSPDVVSTESAQSRAHIL